LQDDMKSFKKNKFPAIALSKSGSMGIISAKKHTLYNVNLKYFRNK
tara:strand:- start:330 stop:467 length:138 start_codon:yes stop_codon:yes gene_type:complete